MSKSIPLISLSKANIFQEKRCILSDINIKIFKGEFVFLIGKTGSGKSSFVKTLYGDLPLKIGQGNVFSYDLRKLKQRQIPFLRRKIGFVFQDFKLLEDRNIFDNLKFVLKATGWKNKKAIDKHIIETLKKIKMQRILEKYPFEISGGEQQRIAIARALLNEPQIIIADEPTGNLDPETSIEIMTIFKELNKRGLSILMATHNYNLIAKFPSKVLQCNNGKIYEVVQKK